MLQRPKPGETEEDLLKQEEEFLKQSGKAPTKKINPEVDNDEKKRSAVSGIVGEVVERNRDLPSHLPSPNDGDEAKSKGFPPVFKIDPNLATDKKGKMSLFALQMKKNKNVGDDVTVETDAPSSNAEEPEPSQESGTDREDTPNAAGSTEDQAMLADVKKSVHEENLNEMLEMSEAEILEAQRKLKESLDDQLIAMLLNRSRPKEDDELDQESETEMEDDDDSSKDDKIKDTLRGYVGEQWVNMDFLESEKLEWVGDIPSADTLLQSHSYNARFNFKGELQPFITEIDVRNALYHHGDEPERPGYTIQELYQLSRSTVLQQRILALNTLANIIYKAKLGYYDSCFDGYLLPKLMSADLFVLLRFSIDENALIPAGFNCMRRLLYNDSDEYCLDKLLGVTAEDLQPLLFEDIPLDSEEEPEVTDDVLIQTDLVRGALRTDVLVRIAYILNHLPCERETIADALFCFIRVARHSEDSCTRMALTMGLLDFIYSRVNCDKPFYQGVKIFRLLTGQSKEVAMHVCKTYQFSFLIPLLNEDSMDGLPRRELYLFKLETIYLWRNLIRIGYMTEDFSSWTPCFVRLLRFYVEKVDFYLESDFDFELFAALMSLLKFCVHRNIPIDTNYMAMLYLIMEKWITQLLRSQKFVYSCMKALGSCFAFFIDYFEVYGSDRDSLQFVRKLNGMVSTLIGSPCFDRMANNLTEYSHLLVAAPISRDPPCLPSLCSVYENGEDFLRIVNNESAFPFFVTLAKYLQFSSDVISGSKTNAELFVNHPAIRRYIYEVISMEKNTGNWFERFELSLLTDLLQLMSIVKNRSCMKLGFRLLPMIRVDDADLVSVTTVVTDNRNWDSTEELFHSLTDISVSLLYEPEQRSGYAIRFTNDAAGVDWPYKMLSKLRGKKAPAEVTQVLKYLSMINRRQPDLIERIPYTLRYYHLCAVFLTDSNVFSVEVQSEMRTNFQWIVQNRSRVDLNMKVKKRKSFYDFYTEIITQYAAISYGMHIFGEMVLFPLQNRFDPSYRKLMWFEYLDALRVINVPYPSNRFIKLEEFVEPHETDEGLLMTYLSAISSKTISKTRNPFVYNLAVANINNYMRNACPDSMVYKVLSRRIRFTISQKIKRDLVSW